MEIKQGYKQTEVGVIPEDWDVKPIGEICSIKRGKFTPRPRNNPIYYGGSIPFVQTGDVTKSNGVIGSYTQTLNDEGLAVSTLFKKGTILMTIAANIGYTGILQMDMACPDSLVAIDGLGKTDNNYLNFYLSFKREKVDELSTAGAQKNLNIERFSPFPIPLPPTKAEQTAIATVLSDMAKMIDGLEKMIEKKKAIKQGAMQELLSSTGSNGKLKEGWVEKKLGDAGECIIGLTYRPDNVKESGLLVLRSSNVQENSLCFDDNVYVDVNVSEKLIVKENDILICVRNGSRDLIGKCALIMGEAVGETFGAFMSVFRSPYNVFIFNCFQSSVIKKQIDEHLGATINQITNKSLNSFEIPFPPLEVQREIVAILWDMDKELAELGHKLSKYKALKQGMMQELLTGKTRLV